MVSILDQVIINAGGASVSYEDYVSTIEELGYEEWRKIISGNLDIGFLFCKYLLVFNRISQHGSITFTSTIHSLSSVLVLRRTMVVNTMGFK